MITSAMKGVMITRAAAPEFVCWSVAMFIVISSMLLGMLFLVFKQAGHRFLSRLGRSGHPARSKF